MYNYQYNIVLLSDDKDRAAFISSFLKDTRNRLTILDYDKGLADSFVENPLDLMVLDGLGLNKRMQEKILTVRNQEKLQKIPFIFIISAKQESLKRQIYKDPYNRIVLDPIDKFVFISAVHSSLQVKDLEHRNRLYEDIIDGEKSLISHMDELLEMNNVMQFEEEKELLRYLEISFIRRMELALAVETALFANYKKTHSLLTINVFDAHSGLLTRKHSFSVKKSIIKGFLEENSSQIFEKQQLSDPFIQELEEALGIKIFSVLFVPLNVFHEPKAAMILVNKIYRDEFSENDLAFSLIASQKIVYHMEKIFLNSSSAAEQAFAGRDKELLKELKLFKRIMDSVHFGAVVFGKSFKIKYLNMSALTVLNYSRSKKSPQYLKDMFSKEEFSSIKEEYNKKDFPVIRKELHLLSANVPHFFIGYSIYDLTGTDGKEQYILIFSEISQTKRIQAEIIRMDRMASLGALSSGIAHEIRNPLAGIKAMAQTLEDELEENSIQSEYVERIIRQVNRLDILLRSFFTYASPARPDPSAFHISKIVNEIVPLISRKMMERKIEIKEKYADDLAQVFVDANQIEQVFLNLFLNAIDAMKEGGTISISAGNAKDPPTVMDRRNPGPGLLSNYFIEIKVTDTGEGISEDFCDRIFTPFYTTKSNGTGLGLSIVYQIIKEHGGRIDAESTVGEGTEFTIILPALQKNRE